MLAFACSEPSRRAASERADGATMLSCDVTDDASVAKLVDEVLAKAKCANYFAHAGYRRSA
jgi:NAD(P)-dependent dehydrogenase (short-subunit alcohol dehydrogenase family)